MASKLERRDIELLNAHITKRVGQKPYEDGLWGTQGNRDFVYFEILDSQNNLIEFKNLSLAEFSVNTNSNIEFYPGKHITELGFDSGTFKVKYHFLNVCQKVQSKYRQDKNLGLELIFDTRVYY